MQWAMALVAGAALCACGQSEGDPNRSPPPSSASLCPLGDAVGPAGERRLALVVGVGDYQNPAIPDLPGASRDAQRFYEALTDTEGFAFDPRNVCLLMDAEASVERFKEVFQQALVDRASDGDVAVLFFAGHGSQTRDTGGDESDGWDETLVLHDSRTTGVSDLRDDVLHGMLGELRAKTRHVAAVFDACSSGTVTRNIGRHRARVIRPANDFVEAQETGGDGAPEALALRTDGMVTLAAARDGTVATERGGQGVFTRALLTAIEQGAVSYSDLDRSVPGLVAPWSAQQPVFSGALDQPLFGIRNVGASLAQSISGGAIDAAVRVKLEADATTVAMIRGELSSGHAQSLGLEIVESGEDFRVEQGQPNTYEVIGPDGHVRNRSSDRRRVASALLAHASQQSMLRLAASGQAKSESQFLSLQIVPESEGSECAAFAWQQAAPNQDQRIPLCHAWRVRVSLASDAPRSINIGAVILSSDGAMYGLPRPGEAVTLRPGQSHVFKRGPAFRAQPPLNSRDRVVVIATETPRSWHLVDRSANTHASVGDDRAPMSRAPSPRDPWGDSRDALFGARSIGLSVVANQRFAPVINAREIKPREYTIADFDIRPYLPNDPESPLHRVLKIADQLANTSREDGLPYKQHDWSLASDELNLARGIDCSRSIWYAFTRAGVPYNRNDSYLYTGAMVGDQSRMHDEFDVCPANQPYELGDVLVYRSDERGDGHTVMVIDADQRIAWGSHGWDGNAQASDYAVEPDTGVEYQKIRFKPDWRRWDRSDMALKACWRYRGFVDSSVESTSSGETAATWSGSCEAAQCRLNP